MVHLQIANPQIYTKYGTTLSKTSHKSRLLKTIFILYKFELEYSLYQLQVFPDLQKF